MNKLRPAIERAKPLRLVGVFALIGICLAAAFLVIQLSASPSYTFKTEPQGAQIYINGQLICKITPCDVPLNGVLPKYVVVDKPNYHHKSFMLLPLGLGWAKKLNNPIELKSNFDAEKRDAALRKCRAEREQREGGDTLDAEACYRFPAVMPWQAERSGHCHMYFDIDAQGRTQRVATNGCTESLFIESSLAAVRGWLYLPAMQDGETVTREGVKARMTFRLSSQSGDIIPEANIFSENSDHEHDIATLPLKANSDAPNPADQ